MRQVSRVGDFSVRAISGTRAVMLAMNADEANLDDFLGFGIGVQKDLTGPIRWLNGFKCFKSLEADPERAQRFSTVAHPVQDFRWGHYWAEPDTEYHYTVRPLFRPQNGDLSQLRAASDLTVSIKTEDETGGDHSVRCCHVNGPEVAGSLIWA